jgi:dihydrolipoamide dehydrogenase
MNYDVIVIGSGPGGYVTAIRASQLGLKTAIIERESLGGICLNWGCIPTKALLKSAQVFEYLNHSKEYGISADNIKADFGAVIKRSRDVADGMSKGIQFLMKKNKIDVIMGTATVKVGKKVEVKAADGKVSTVEGKHIIIATGARSRVLPNLPQDGKKIIGYREAMTLPKLPKTMVVVGSGAIGVEFAYFYATMGTKVTIVEFMPNIVPVEDEEVSKQLEKSLKKTGIEIMTEASVESVDTKGDTSKVNVKTKTGNVVLEAEIVLSAVGIEAHITGLGLETVGIATDKGKIVVDKYYATNVPISMIFLWLIPEGVTILRTPSPLSSSTQLLIPLYVNGVDVIAWTSIIGCSSPRRGISFVRGDLKSIVRFWFTFKAGVIYLINETVVSLLTILASAPSISLTSLE